MIKHIRWTAILATALIVMALPVQSEIASKRVSSLQSRVDALLVTFDLTARRYDIARTAFKLKQAQVEAGTATAGELAPLQEQLAFLEAQMRQNDLELLDAKRLVKLAGPVDVELTEASLRQVAEALTKATGLQIGVDGGVKDDPQRAFTLKVQGAPLGQVLEQIADSAKVLIAPEESGGVVLVPEAYGSINGQSVSPTVTYQPWSNDWAIVGAYSATIGQRWLGLIQAAAPVPAPSSMMGLTTGGYAVIGSPQYLVAGMGPDMFVVGEPGTNEKGELGLWLQFYKIAGNKVTPGIRYFHHFAAAQAEAPK